MLAQSKFSPSSSTAPHHHHTTHSCIVDSCTVTTLVCNSMWRYQLKVLGTSVLKSHLIQGLGPRQVSPQIASQSVEPFLQDSQSWLTQRQTHLRYACDVGWNWLYLSTHTHTHPFNGPFSGTTRVGRYQKGKKQSGFYWSKRQWVAMASAGPYASLHLAPDR